MSEEELAKQLVNIFKSITPSVQVIGAGFFITQQGKTVFIPNTVNTKRSQKGQSR